MDVEEPENGRYITDADNDNRTQVTFIGQEVSKRLFPTVDPIGLSLIHIYLKEAFADEFKSADVLLLGCTHYPLIQPCLLYTSHRRDRDFCRQRDGDSPRGEI